MTEIAATMTVLEELRRETIDRHRQAILADPSRAMALMKATEERVGAIDRALDALMWVQEVRRAG